MPNRQVKKIEDEENQELLEQFVRLNLKDRDNIDFDFEADLIKMIKKLNVTKLVNNDRNHIEKFINTVIALYERVYLGEVLKAGQRQGDRFLKLFTESANAG